jgi:hypothetical protein
MDLLVTLRALPGLRPAEIGGTALRTRLEVERELPQSRCDTVVLFMGRLRMSIVTASRCQCGSFAFFGRPHLDAREDFIRGQHPIHRNRVTTLARTTQPQRSIPARPTAHLDLSASNDLAAYETVTSVIQRTPFAKLIEAAQHIQSICVRQYDGRR